MKGLDREELDFMGLVARGRCVLSRLEGSRGRSVSLLGRGLVAESTVSCGAYDCVGHQSLAMTSVGVMVWNAVCHSR